MAVEKEKVLEVGIQSVLGVFQLRVTVHEIISELII
jgi:hypothetical protein